ncbi:MAG: ornithine carbamoyltransferase [Planctomycetota bacterium]
MSVLKTTATAEVLVADTLGGVKGKSFLGVQDLSTAELQHVLRLATEVKATPEAWSTALSGLHAALVFEKPSLRTRVSFEIGLTKLGMHAIYLDQKGSKLGERESLKDFAKNIERFVDLVVARVFDHAALEGIVEHASIPVVNALSDAEHPCQALADVLTLSEHLGDGFVSPDGGLGGKKLAWIGDGNNVCHSLMLAAAALGVSQTIITPKGFEPRFEILRAATEKASASGAKIELASDLTAVEGHDAVYTDCWVSMGQDHQGGIREQAFGGFQVDDEIMAKASKGLGKGSIFMHCLPAHRGEEVTDTVIDSDQSVVYDQAENRMHAQNALVLALMGKA